LGSLKLENVSKSFGEVEVIKGVDLTVGDGEFCVFVGPSGCGKSTLLRMIAGLEDTTSGDILIDGNRVNQMPPSKREISMVFQSYALYPHLTVRNNMALGLKQSGASAETVSERVRIASDMLSLGEYLDRRPAELSGGQRQRVAIGRSIVRTPKIFLFDEPLSNLDAALRVNTRIEIARLHRELGATMVYVTHDQVEAMTLADRIVVLNAGRIAQAGAPMELYNNPANLFVAGFIGSPQMNLIDASGLSAGAKTLGIRPEHVEISRESGEMPGTISHVEHLGGETNIFVRTDAHGLMTVRKFGEHSYSVDEQVWLTPDATRQFLFDDAGERIQTP
jgi:multiple sugar transport system ATP-binding protein